MKKIYLISFLVVFTIFFGRHLLPGNQMFDFHDVSQPGRIAEFSYDITHSQFPPRIAPHMSYGMGYPVFNYYAPFSYWVSGFIHLIGFDIADSIKVSFYLALVLSFIGMFYFLRSFFKEVPSLFGAFLYAVSPYLAMEIFARGNLGEVWFLALLPTALYFIQKNIHTSSVRIFAVTAIITSFTLTVHNVLSLLFLPMVVVYILLLKQGIRKNFFTLLISLLLSSYFLIPALAESSFTNATRIAEFTNYKDHFLCWWQIWTTNGWGYGASNPGCLKDGISFMIGKAQVVFGILGILLLLVTIFRKRKIQHSNLFIFIAVISVGSAFMSTYSSQPVWDVVRPLAVFQFPWRFLIFTLFGFAFFSTYFFSEVKISPIKLLMPIVFLFIIIYQSKYFYKPPLTKSNFNQMYINDIFIKENVAYRVAEYLPKKGNYKFWRSIENNPNEKDQLLSETRDFLYPLDGMSYSVTKNTEFDKKALTSSHKFLINIHYLPNWHIKINNKEVVPDQFDALARPVIETSTVLGGLVELTYEQTPIEKSANALTVLGFILIALTPHLFRGELKVRRTHDRS